jgi:hypothetical protein
MTILLLPVGRDRFELYSEPVDSPAVGTDGEGRVRRWLRAAREHWRGLEDTARRHTATSRFGRWRDRIVCSLSDRLAEQRTAWTLAEIEHATLLYPSTLAEDAACAIRDQILVRSRRQHLVWGLVHGALFAISVVLAPIPGPNLVAYYAAFRAYGHLQAWRGARRGVRNVTWTFRPDAILSELCSLAGLARDERRSRVDAIAARLNVPHLSAFFERVVV